MALSERERELLAQLEKQLNEDPAFTSTMTGPQPLVAPAVSSSPRNLVIGALVAVVGLGRGIHQDHSSGRSWLRASSCRSLLCHHRPQGCESYRWWSVRPPSPLKS